MRALLLAAVLLPAILPASSAQAPESLPTDRLADRAAWLADFEALAADHPGLVRFEVLGASARGADLWRLDVADFSAPGWEGFPALVVDGGHHGNEFSGMYAAKYFVEALVEAAAADPSVLEGTRVVVVPVVNPDGWALATRFNAQGVNLNRNYPHLWNSRGTDPAPFMADYAGPSEGSEPETKLVMSVLGDVDARAYLSYHCCGPADGGELVWPWEPDVDAPFPDEALYQRFVEAAKTVGVMGDRAPSGGGESITHAYGNLGIVAFIPETPPDADAPAMPDDVRREALAEHVDLAFLALQHLHHLGGELVLESRAADGILVRNTGWGPAYDVPGVGTIEPGATATIATADACTVTWRRLAVGAAERPPVSTLPDCEPPLGEAAPALALPAPAVVGVLALALVAARLRRR